MVDEVQLDAQQQRVYRAAAEVEGEGEPGTLHEIARRAGVDVESARHALSALIGDRDLLRELPTRDPDIGSRYSLKGQPAPE